MPQKFVRLFQSLALIIVHAWLVARSSAQSVVINEVSSSSSDRLVQRDGLGRERLGADRLWYDVGYEASWWKTASGPWGYGITGVITDTRSDMARKTPTLYLRKEFTLTAEQANQLEAVVLEANYEDGLVVFLNGYEVARRNAGQANRHVFHHQVAFNEHLAGTVEAIPLNLTEGRLRAGVNVIAVQGMDHDLEDNRFFLSVSLKMGSTTLVSSTEPWSYLVGKFEPSGGWIDPTDFTAAITKGPDWTQIDYAATNWSTQTGALGYDTATDYTTRSGQITNNLTQMHHRQIAVFGRSEFTLTNEEKQSITALTLRVDYDDGCVVYLNGYEVARLGFDSSPGTLVAFNQPASSSHGARYDGGQDNASAVVTVSLSSNLLLAGKNVLAVQGHNDRVSSSDLLVDAQLEATSPSGRSLVNLSSTWAYLIPTAEFQNASHGAEVPAPSFYDWVEFYNPTNATIDLGQWALSDDPAQPLKWRFPAGTSLAPQGYLVVTCSGREVTSVPPGGRLHASFTLNGAGHSLVLRNPHGVLVQELAVPKLDPFHTYGKTTGNEYRQLDQATPGRENHWIKSYAEKMATPTVSVESGFYATPQPVTLSGPSGAIIRYTTDGSEPTMTNGINYQGGPITPVRPNLSPGTGEMLVERWKFNGSYLPPAALPVTTPPTSAQIVNASASPAHVDDQFGQRLSGYVHIETTGQYRFYLASDDQGELYLSTNDNPANKQLIARVNGWTNTNEWTREANQESAFITLTAGQRYYIEARASEGGGGDHVMIGWRPPGVTTTELIPPRLISAPEVLPSNVIYPMRNFCLRARAFGAHALPSEIITRHYVYGADPRISTIPAVFLTGAARETFYAPHGIFSISGGDWVGEQWRPNQTTADYNFCLVRGDAFERRCEMEIIDPGNVVSLRTGVGARFSGSQWSRPRYRLDNFETANWNDDWLKKPQLNLFFRDDFGVKKLTQAGFIPGSHLNDWQTLRLRAGKNDAYNPFIVDEFMRRCFREMGRNPAPLGKFTTLFINGELKSYFNLTERPRASFFEEYYDVTDNWDVNYIGEFENGDRVNFDQMQQFFRNNSFATLANYQQGTAMWDVVNVADYFVINSWGATQDWPWNNYLMARERVPGGRWVFSMWDAEGAMGIFGQLNTHNSFDRQLLRENGNALPAISSDGVPVRMIFRRFYESPEFRLLFADRLQKHFFNGGVMARTPLETRWNGLKNTIAPLIKAIKGQDFYDRYALFWSNRTDTLLAQCRAEGLWPLTAAPTISPFGGTVAVGSTVTLNHSNSANAQIYYTLDGSDPRAVGGAVAGTAYSQPITVNRALTVKARVLSGTEWSPIVEANFAPPVPQIVVTEIHYNPSGSTDATEFIELMNTGSSVASLFGAHFTLGVEYTFGEVSLAPGQRLVLVKDAAAFTAAYPGVTIAGVYLGSLANEGETLRLVDIRGNPIFSVTYSDARLAGWPAEPDGEGYSLVLMRPEKWGNTADPAHWRASARTSGAPGQRDSLSFDSASAIADADGDGYPALVEYVTGSDDQRAHLRPRFDLSLGESGSELRLTFEKNLAVDDTDVVVEWSADLVSWSLATKQTSRRLVTGMREEVWVKPTAPSERPVYWRLRATLHP